MGNKQGKPVSQRQLRVGEMIKQSLGMIFVRNEAKVPNVETNNITVTEVKMSQDLKIAKAYVLPLGGQDAEEKIENLSKHIKQYQKDKHSSVGLLKAVNRRKKLLDYLKRNKIDSYKNVLTKLNLRK